jgi:hypothetical protein
MKRIIVIALTSLTIAMLFTSPLFSKDNNFGYIHVWGVQVAEDNYLYVVPLGNYDLNKHDGTNAAWGRSKYPITDERTKAMMTIALSSLIGRKYVHIYTEGYTTGSGYPIITMIIIRSDKQ